MATKKQAEGIEARNERLNRLADYRHTDGPWADPWHQPHTLVKPPAICVEGAGIGCWLPTDQG